MAKQLYNKTGLLFRFILRRDRIRIPVWLLSLCVVTFAVANAFNNMYSSDQERQAMAETMKNPAMTAMVGKGYGLNHYTTGAMMAHQMLLFTAITVGIMSILLVTRHTRADEEDGRIEMVRSLPTGRLSNLFSTILVLIGTNVLLALLSGFGLYALGDKSMDLDGSLLYGAALGATGIFFAAITAVFSQISENSRGTIGLSFAILGISYLIRAVGDVSNEALSWFSPLGWVLGAEVYVNNYWWPILLTIGVSFIFIILALYLNAIRDLESGFLPSKPGKKHASTFLQSPLGLTLRLQRTGLITWAIGMFVLGASYGSVLGDLDAFIKDNEILRAALTAEGFSFTEQFITMLMSIMAMLSTIPALMSVLKLIGEERKNRTEQLLALAVSRTRLIGSSLLVSIIVSFAMLSLAVLGIWAAGATVMDDGMAFSTLFAAAHVYLPAIWVMIGIATLLVGIAPKFTSSIWLYLTYSFIVIYLGELLQFPEWISKLSPYGHISKLPIEDMDFMKATVLTLIALALVLIGFIAYRKRDIHG
ncbi:ABC transporter permease [Bacillus sp. FJAT-50079]|uniref:ABC transporter permease n=1 Tax=Bacillus sp. FJAT-50079 TaxID=2833577 RepID=UPI001BCA15A8|nr:ABC transporter permease [Bacillus sp. FJAT-50079]MBS4210081.1 ABC transporter permease [Bacillus sp. FJAT-50079]